MKKIFIILMSLFMFISLTSCNREEKIHYCNECGSKIYSVFNYYEKNKYKVYRFPASNINFEDESVIMKSKEDVLKFDNTGEILRTFVTKNYEGYFKSNSLILIYCKNIEIKSIKKISFDENILTILVDGSKEETYSEFVCVIEMSNFELKKVDSIIVKNTEK